MSVEATTNPMEHPGATAFHPPAGSVRPRRGMRWHGHGRRKILTVCTSAAAVPALEVEHLHKRYGERVALEDVSFSVAPGEIFGILGPNGAGKTSTVECAQGLRSVEAGVVRVFGLDPQRDAAPLRGRIGSQLQASGLPDRLKVWEALDLFASLTPAVRGTPDLLDRWGLTERRNTCFADLSGGERQRLFVALALVGAPEIIFLDELTQGLDPTGRQVAWQLIREIRDRGCTVVLVTHYMDEAERLCDRLAVINHGRVVATGTARQLIARSRAEIRVHFNTDATELSWLNTIEGVREVLRRGPHVQVRGVGALLARVAAALVENGVIPADLCVEQPTLEDAYVQLTTPTTAEHA
jgi:ABC-2 type transport system ATP-binding protein